MTSSHSQFSSVIVGETDRELLVYVAETAREEHRRRIVISELYRGKFPEPAQEAPNPDGHDLIPPSPSEHPPRSCGLIATSLSAESACGYLIGINLRVAR